MAPPRLPVVVASACDLLLSGQIRWIDCDLYPGERYRIRALAAGGPTTADNDALVVLDLPAWAEGGLGISRSKRFSGYTYLRTGPGLSRTDRIVSPRARVRRVGFVARHAPLTLRTLSIERLAPPDRRPDVFLSFDVEAQPGRAAGDLIDQLVWGRIGQNEVGIPRICSVLEQHGIVGNFMVDFATCASQGDRRLHEIVDYLAGRGHEVHMHLHPEYLDPALGYTVDDRAVCLDRTPYDLSRRLLDLALDAYTRTVERPPQVFRAGSYRINDHLVRVAGELGIPALSNVKPHTLADVATEGDQILYRAPFRWTNGVLELPVDVSSPEVSRPETYAAKFEDAVWRKPAEPTFNVVMHSWSLMRRNDLGHHDAHAAEYEERLHQICEHARRQGRPRGYAEYLRATPERLAVQDPERIRVQGTEPSEYGVVHDLSPARAVARQCRRHVPVVRAGRGRPAAAVRVGRVRRTGRGPRHAAGSGSACAAAPGPRHDEDTCDAPHPPARGLGPAPAAHDVSTPRRRSCPVVPASAPDRIERVAGPAAQDAGLAGTMAHCSIVGTICWPGRGLSACQDPFDQAILASAMIPIVDRLGSGLRGMLYNLLVIGGSCLLLVGVVAVAGRGTLWGGSASPDAPPESTRPGGPVAVPGELFRLFLAPHGSDSNFGTTADQPLATLAGAEEVLRSARPTGDVEIRIAQGDYTAPETTWDYYVEGHSISFMPADYEEGEGLAGIGGRPIFKSDGTAGWWLRAELPDGHPGGDTNLRFYYLDIVGYSTGGLTINGGVATNESGYRIAATAGANHNHVFGMVFRQLGSKYGPALGYGGVDLVNSSNNEILNSHFEYLENTEPDDALIHGVYVAHHSTRNRVVDNRFDEISGVAVNVRNSSNDNEITGNIVERSGRLAAYYDWYCDDSCAQSQTEPLECPSYGNVFRDNDLVSAYDGGNLPVSGVTAPDKIGQSPPCGDGTRPRVTESGNT